MTLQPSYNWGSSAGTIQGRLEEVFAENPHFGRISAQTGRKTAISCDLPDKPPSFSAPLGHSGHGADA